MELTPEKLQINMKKDLPNITLHKDRLALDRVLYRGRRGRQLISGCCIRTRCDLGSNRKKCISMIHGRVLDFIRDAFSVLCSCFVELKKKYESILS